MLKSMILRAVAALGYELRPREGRDSLAGVLRNARAAGFRPASVIDVGAAFGDFSLACAAAFPEAEYLLVEPLEEYRPHLQRARRSLPRSHCLEAAAGAGEGEVVLHVHPDLVGSSIFREREDSDVNGVPRTVPQIPLDAAVAGRGLAPPHLLKIDVQGAELRVIEGAAGMLAETGLVILETSLLPFFDGAPLFHEMVAAMEARGFVVYDLLGLGHRPLDRALAQVDLVFARKDGPLRRHSHYADAEQRAALTRTLQRRLRP